MQAEIHYPPNRNLYCPRFCFRPGTRIRRARLQREPASVPIPRLPLTSRGSLVPAALLFYERSNKTTNDRATINGISSPPLLLFAARRPPFTLGRLRHLSGCFFRFVFTFSVLIFKHRTRFGTLLFMIVFLLFLPVVAVCREASAPTVTVTRNGTGVVSLG